MNWREAGLLAQVVAVMVAVDAMWLGLVWAASLAMPGTVTPEVRDALATFEGVFKLVVMIVFARWIYVAGRRLVEAGFDGLEFTPASRIWWFAVPFANLVKPFQGMRELHNASVGVWAYDRNDALVSGWWALWLINGVAAYAILLVTGLEPQSLGAIAISAALDMVVGALAIVLVLRIASAQARLPEERLADVFA